MAPLPRRPLSIVHVSQSTDAGVGFYVAASAADQIARGWRVAVVCPPVSPPDHMLADRAAQAGATVVPWPATNSPGARLPDETRRLHRILDGIPADVVHLHSSKAGLAGRLALRGEPATIFQPNAWSFWALDGALRKAALLWERAGARWADAIVCVSEGELRAAREAGIAATFRLIPNAVDLSRFPPATTADRAGARGRLGLPDGPLAVCVGRLSRQKGQDVLLDAWPAVKAVVPEARLAIVGVGPERRALEERRLPDVLFPGFRDDVSDWLAAADVAVLPSRWEGMSFTMLEAMARGRSVVATDVPGAREALESGGGAVVPVGDRDALARALSERLTEPAKADEEGGEGRRRIEALHDLCHMAAAVAELYVDVLAARASPRR